MSDDCNCIVCQYERERQIIIRKNLAKTVAEKLQKYSNSEEDEREIAALKKISNHG